MRDDPEGSVIPPLNLDYSQTWLTGYEWIFEFPTVIDATKHLWDKVAISNDYITPAFPNFKKSGRTL